MRLGGALGNSMRTRGMECSMLAGSGAGCDLAATLPERREFRKSIKCLINLEANVGGRQATAGNSVLLRS